MKGKLLKKLCAVSLAAFMLVGTGVTEVGYFVGAEELPPANEELPPANQPFFYTKNSDGGITITGCIGGETNIVIPNDIYGKKVTSIGDCAFYGCSNLTSVTIPESVTSIGSSAFDGCSSLTSVTIPNSVTSIGSSAFYGCSNLTSVTIPESVTSIGSSAFGGCSSLSSIKVNKNNTIYSSKDGVLYNKNKTTLIICPQVKKTVTIPDSVTKINSFAFDRCSNLTSINIPDSVINIEESAFYGCSNLMSIKVTENNTAYSSQDGVLYDKNKSTIIACAGGKTAVIIPCSVTTIGEYAFNGCSNLISVTIPDSVTSIANEAFSGCSSLISVTIPDSVTSIESYAFSGCSSLTSINIPDSVKRIGYCAFDGCSSLTSVSIPDSVTSIESYAFRECSSLTSVSISENVTSINWDAFYRCSSFTSIKVSKNNTTYSSKDGILYDKNKTELIKCPQGKTSVTIPDSVTSIANEAFSGCSSLASVTIPDSVKSIGWRAFSHCSSLTSVSIPNSVTNIGVSTFFYCSSLTSVIIPDSVTSIEWDAFYGCSSLTIYGNKGSHAESYAKNNNIRFATNNIVYGESAEIICAPIDTSKTYKYAVYYKHSTATKWTTAQNYSENTEVSFKPKHTGLYNVSVNAKDATGKVKKVKFDITVNPSLKNTSTVSANSIKLGETVNITAASTGGLGKKVYEVYYKNSTQTKWTRAQKYSDNTAVAVTPRHTGTYTICVRAKDERGKVVKKNLTVTVKK